MFSLLSPWVLSLSLLPRLPPPLPPGPPPSAAAIAQGGRLAPPAMLLAPVVMGEGTGSELAFYSLPVPLDKVLVNLEGRASEHPLAAAVEEDACALLGAAGLDDGEQLSLTLCDDDMIRDLNSEWRSVDRPTDVLSFPMDDEQLLGDLVVSVETASRQAIDRSHTLRDELRVSRCALRPPPSALRPPPSALRPPPRSTVWHALLLCPLARALPVVPRPPDRPTAGQILMVHGLLHLLGYDHEESHDAHVEMAAAERKLLGRLGWRGEGLIDAVGALTA